MDTTFATFLVDYEVPVTWALVLILFLALILGVAELFNILKKWLS